MKGQPPRRAPSGATSDLLALAGFALAVFVVAWPLGLTNRVPAGIDAYTYFTPYWAYRMDALAAGRVPLWNPYLFLGAPFLANPQAAVLYPLHWPLALLRSASQALVWSALLHAWLAAAFTYALGRRAFGLTRPAAFLAGLLFGLGGYTLARVENINQLNALAWLPALIWFYHEASAETPGLDPRVRLRSGVALACATALAILAGHTQTTFVDLAGLGLYAGSLLAASAARRDGLRRAAALLLPLLALAPALLLAAAQLLPTLELNGLGLRTGGLPYRQAVSFSLRPGLLAQSLLPPLAGGLDQGLAQAFGSEGYAEFVGYLGVSAIVLAVIGTFSPRFSVFRSESSAQDSKSRTQNPRLPLVVLAVAGFILALGAYNPLYYLLWRLVPGFALFRAPARWLALYALGMAGLAGFGLDALLHRRIVESVGRGKPTAAEKPLRQGARPETRTDDPAGRRHNLRRRVAAGAALATLLLVLVVQQYPAWTTVAGWALAGLLACALIALSSGGPLWPPSRRVRNRTAAAPKGDDKGRPYGYRPGNDMHQPQGAGPGRASEASPYPRYARGGLIALAVAELWLGSRALPFAMATAPAAVEGLRGAPAALLAAAAGQPAAARARFLSLSDLRFDPGDLGELRGLEADRLPAPAVERFVRAAKQQEVIAPNLSMLLGLPAVDGYDGGILPLGRYLKLQSLFVRADPGGANRTALTDGRLREQLRQVPPDRLLDLTATHYLVTDKQNDLWAGDVYYDLEQAVTIPPGQRLTLDLAGYPPFSATALGVVSYVDGPAEYAGPVAQITLTDGAGGQQGLTLSSPGDTAWSRDPVPSAGRAPARAWPTWLGVGHDWLAVKDFAAGAAGCLVEAVSPGQCPFAPQSITIQTEVNATGPLVLRGLSLIDRRTGAHQSITLSARGDRRRIYSGDVKIYERTAAPGRAWLVHQTSSAADEEAALALLADPAFDPRLSAIITGSPRATGRAAGPEGDRDVAAAGTVTLVSGEPELLAFRTGSTQPGTLVLADAAYPGWEVTVDGQPAPLLTANLMFRAVDLPAGQHDVIFIYRPRTWQIGLIISLATLALLLVTAIAARFVVRE